MAYLGLDCGGSKTRWSHWPASAGQDGITQGVQPAAHGEEQAAAALVAALRTAAAGASVQAAVCAIAGAGAAALRQRRVAYAQAQGFEPPLALVGDTLAAAAAALADGPGLLVWAGTGSFAVARATDGSLHRAGGRGHLLGDQGSGYDLVRRAAAAVVLAVDGLAPPTLLTEALCTAFAAVGPHRLGAVLQGLSTGQLAAQLPVVLDCAARGDAAAAGALDEGMSALAMVANAAVRSAGLDWSGLPSFVGGGVLTNLESVRGLLAQRMLAFGAGEPAILATDAGARGAALLARDWAEGREPMHGWVQDGSL